MISTGRRGWRAWSCSINAMPSMASIRRSTSARSKRPPAALRMATCGSTVPSTSKPIAARRISSTSRMAASSSTMRTLRFIGAGAPSGGRCARAPRGSSDVASTRQEHREATALAFLRLDGDAAAVRVDSAARNREPESGPARVLVRLPIPLEDVRQGRRGDPAAGVLYLDLDFGVGVGVDDAHDDAPAARREAHRVRDEIDDDLHQAVLVAADDEPASDPLAL